MSSSPRQSRTLQRNLALASVAVAAAGLLLMRQPTPQVGPDSPPLPQPIAGQTSVQQALLGVGQSQLQSAGLSADLLLSQTAVRAGQPQELFGDLRVRGAATEKKERAPLALAVVLDTSGSMDGQKMRDAVTSVKKLIAEMRDDDEIALVRYDNSATVVQPLARVGAVRTKLLGAVSELTAGGGTNIPAGLASGLSVLGSRDARRVERVVLVSDGLDNGRSSAADAAKQAAQRGVTISSLGIGEDFDQSYMAELARIGHGNFAYAKSGDARELDRFLSQELRESAATVARSVRIKIDVPASLQLQRVVGAEITERTAQSVTLDVGALFDGDERRITLQWFANLPSAARTDFGFGVSFDDANGQRVNARGDKLLSLVAVASDHEVNQSRNVEVQARAVSALASVAQLEAAEAYDKGDLKRAEGLIKDSLRALDDVAAAAPAAAPMLEAQAQAYRADQSAFRSAPSGSGAGKAAAKSAAARESSNLGRAGSYSGSSL